MRIATLTAAALALTAGIAAAAPFSSVDRNDDGVVTKGEFLRIYGGDLDVSTFRVIDQDHDGVVSVSEYEGAKNGPFELLEQGS